MLGGGLKIVIFKGRLPYLRVGDWVAGITWGINKIGLHWEEPMGNPVGNYQEDCLTSYVLLLIF